MLKRMKGFTLIEVLLVVIILGLLAAIVLPRFVTSSDKARSTACRTNIHDLNIAWEDQHATDATWTSLTSLLADTSRFPDGTPTCPFATPYADTNPANYRVDYSLTHDQHPDW